jgi:hypothetical protein
MATHTSGDDIGTGLKESGARETGFPEFRGLFSDVTNLHELPGLRLWPSGCAAVLDPPSRRLFCFPSLELHSPLRSARRPTH